MKSLMKSLKSSSEKKTTLNEPQHYNEENAVWQNKKTGRGKTGCRRHGSNTFTKP